MRIGILTLPLHANYGGILQAYALQTVLQDMGHDIVVFGKQRKPVLFSLFQVVKTFAKRICITVFTLRRQDFYNINNELLQPYRNIEQTEQHTRLFINRYIHERLFRDISKEINVEDYDAIIVGSDQVWRPKFFKFFWPLENAFLSFACNEVRLKRIAYAVSFGTDNNEYSEEEQRTCKSLVEKFDFIGCREKGGIGLCKSLFGIDDAVHVLDPTMLLVKNQYLKLFSKQKEETKNELLVYVLNINEEKEKIVRDIACKTNLNPTKINSRFEEYNAPIKERIQPPVEKWLEAFNTMSMVVTDSFHACVFSIIFNKPFWVMLNSEGDESRFVSLLELFQLQDRLINLHSLRADWDIPIDWVSVNKILKVQREYSLQCLRNSIEG